VAVSGNRVEGMAVSKLSGLLILGLPAPFFIFDKIQYLLFFLPSFWLAKLSVEGNVIYFAVCILVSMCWGGLLYRKFKKKII
jgi:fluoroquinolone transport system permease protein